ncbi:MAG: hypothetical protein KKF85_13475 [Gammaproteobacteria bacterium]|nr:hypothetical protein [Rhodocyclaceae bacterium]MBU3910043.1 hypothetical protein [Gammaproteobacteria bacterium]MBU3988564.1 hypothetical protein [Gammaproteobacteria bacterium]MBU4004016.1 hypothetical protein [Gammaproteobacteria bacterium]MBU4020263.1 hypothetical protein [Gammaproteobacteria bacterium]
MKKISAFVLIVFLMGCGIETAGTAATVATLKAQEAKQGQEDKEKIVNQLDAVSNQAEQRLKEADNKSAGY